MRRVAWILLGLALVAAAMAPVVRTRGLRSEARNAEVAAAALRTPILRSPAAAPATADQTLLRLERAPEALLRPVLDRRFAAELEPLVASWPEPYCLDVRLDGRPVFSIGDEPQIPASVEKLLTAAAVLSLIDPQERFVTTAVTTGEIVDGRLEGDVWIVGGGDPLITTLDYSDAYRRQPQLRTPIEDLADAIAALGVTRIEGRLYGDDGRYDQERYVATWPARYQTQHNSGPLSALTVNDGFTAWTPRRQDAANPATHFADTLRTLLRQRGVLVSVGTGAQAAPPEAMEIARVESPPVVEVVQQMLRESDNNTGELLLKELAYREHGLGTTIEGAAIAASFVAAMVSGEEQPVVLDGSGLDRGNLVTCPFLSELLVEVGFESALAGGLPVAAETGTLAHRFAESDAAGRLLAKTGLLNNVNGLAGYVVNDGSVVTFTQLLNGIPLPGGLGIDLQDELVELLLRHPSDLTVADVLDPERALDDARRAAQARAAAERAAEDDPETSE